MTVPTVERGFLRGGLLLDGDGRRQALDVIDIGLLHQLQELARIGRQRFDIAALALGIDRVEGERGFARARQAGQHRQRVARNLDVDILEIVLARAADGDVFQHRSIVDLEAERLPCATGGRCPRKRQGHAHGQAGLGTNRQNDAISSDSAATCPQEHDRHSLGGAGSAGRV